MIHLAIALGGLAGAFARYGLGEWVVTWAGTEFPWATFATNLSGSLLLGGLMQALPRTTVPAATRAGLTVGLCGGFTTFSTFSFETVGLLRRGAWGLASLYVGGSAAGGVVAVVAGMSLAGLLLQHRLASAPVTAGSAEPAPSFRDHRQASDPPSRRAD